MNQIALEAHNLTVSYAKKAVLWNMDFKIPTGKMVGILGPNGSGKTTLLKCAMNLLEADGGYTKLLNEDLSTVRDKISFVPQRQSVDWDFPISVEEVVEMGLFKAKSWRQKSTKTNQEKIAAALEQVEMQSFAKKQIGELSGGQQQRVFIARALVRDADLYLLDEPYVGIDAATEKKISSLLKSLVAKGKSVITVHHDLKSVTEYYDWLLMMNNHVIANGPCNEVYTPENIAKTYDNSKNPIDILSDILFKEKVDIKSYKDKV